MADNTRKTSNIIHEVAEVKDDVSNNSQNITNLSQNLTTLDGEAIKKINGVVPNNAGDITLAEGDHIDIVENTANNNLTISANLSGYAPTSSLYDKAINLSASNGVEVTQNGNTSGNNQSDKEWKLQANYTEIKDNINLALNDLSDVSNTSVSNGQVLTYNGSMWTAANSSGGGNITGGVTSLNGEDGVINITSANKTLNVGVDNANNPKTINLELNGTIPSVPSNIVETLNKLSGNLTLESSDNNIVVDEDGTDKINLTLNASLNDLKNVSTGTPSDNQVLTWNGSNWISQNASGGTFKTINATQPDASGNFNIINGTGINATPGTNNLTLECTVKNTDTGIVSLKSGVATVDGGDARQVEFESSDSSVQFELSGGNKIDLTVPAAGLNIKDSVDYAEPQTEADGTYTDGNGEVHKVLWLPSQYLEAASGVDNPALGDLYIVQYEGSAAFGPPPGTDFYGHGYVFALKSDGSGDYEWSDAGRISGPPGQDGTSISLEEDVTVNSDATILTSTGKFSTTANPGEYELTLNIAPSDVTVGNLSELTDVCDTDPKDKQVLAWDKANSTWCPANATAAAALPISDNREPITVTLDSPDPSTFSINIGASKRVIVDSDSSDFEGKIICSTFTAKVDVDPAEIQMSSNIVFECLKLTRFNASGTTVVEVNGEDFSVGINTVATDKAGLTVKTKVVNPTYGTQGVWSNGSVSPTTQAGRFFDSFLSQPIIAAASSCEVIHFRAFDNAASTTTGSHVGFFASGLTAGTTKNYGFWSQVASEDGKTNYAFYASSSAPSYFNGDVITSTIRAKDGKKGAIVLNDDMLLDGQTVTIEVGPPDGRKKIETGDNTSNVAGGNGVYFSSQLNDLAFSSNEIRFNSNWSAGATEPTWVMTEDSGFVGNNNFNYVKCGSISGTVNNDASVTLGDTFVVSTGNPSSERLKVTDKGYVGFNCDPTYRFQVQGVNNSGDVTTDSMHYSGGILYCNNTADAPTGFYFQTNTSGGTATRSLWGLTTQYPSVGKDSNLELRNTSFKSAGADTTPIFSFTTEKNFIVHEGQVKTPSISGLNSNDASVTLDDTCEIDANSGLIVKTSGHSTARLYVQNKYSQFNGPLWVSSGTAAAPGIRSSNEKTGLCIGENGANIISASIDGTTCMSLQPNENSFINVAKVTGSKDPDSDASVTLGDQATLTKGDGSEYVPSNSASIATVQYVDDVLSGGQVPEDTIPGTGANFRWTEKTIEVPVSIDGVSQPNQQNYNYLYGYDGIFTDGLHWTPDGYDWHTSDPTKPSPDSSFYNGYLKDRGRVTKGLGNEYLAANYISNDMKSWRRIQSSYGDGPVFLGGEIYSNNGQAILNRTLNKWDATGTYFGGDLTSSPYITVASQESGLYSMCVNPSDGTAYWNTAVDDGYPSGYTKISAIADGDGALDCLFSERMQKWMVVGTDKFWITDTANIAVANWTEMDLPTASNWNRIVDDGGSISLLNTADNANVVLYCIEPSGPATTSDWNTTVSIDNRGYVGFAGTNGRTIASMADDLVVTDEDGVTVNTRVYYYSVGGDLRLEQTTATLSLGTPVDTRAVADADVSPLARLETQADANGYFNEEIKKRAIVVTLTQAAYDAIPADEIDDSTLYLIT